MISGKYFRPCGAAVLLLGAWVLGLPPDTAAQAYPSKPIRVVVPNPAGDIAPCVCH